MGLGQKTGIEIEGEGQPLIKNVTDKSWSGVTLPQMAIGYEVLQTPLQTLTFYNAIANNGRMVKPKLVDQIKEDGKVIEEIPTTVILDKICTDKALFQAKEMLEAVVEYGTAKSIKNPYFKIAGKTGTAQMLYDGEYGKSKYQASFAGYFPADNPEYSIVVVVSAPNQAGFYASEVAAPIFKEIAYKVYASDVAMRADSNRYIPQKNFDYPYSKNGYVPYLRDVFTTFQIPVSYTENLNWGKTHSKKNRVQITKNEPFLNMFMPDVKGMSVMDAIYLLENKGLRVVLKGGSGYIRSQSIPRGRKVNKGQTVELIVT
jgi:cell division protein FtsI (penicillin-binding protein 3)